VHSLEGGRFTVDGVEFVTGWQRPSIAGSLTIVKDERMVEPYRELFARYPHPRVVELGIYQGGSVALIALLAKPRKLLAFELEEAPVEPLLELLRERGLEEVVRPYFGVDQRDKARLAQVLDDEIGDEPLDVVVDDASHLYEPSVASFEVLFPRLRPGGAYVIEDWTAQDILAMAVAHGLRDPDSASASEHERLRDHMANLPGSVPISHIALDLALGCAQAGGIVGKVVLTPQWIVVHRGDQEVDPSTFRLQDLYEDHYRVLAR
jgi:predicted O-methyltransferase YrrM